MQISKQISNFFLFLHYKASKQHRLKRYHSQRYVNGSKCDLNGNPRETEVRVRPCWHFMGFFFFYSGNQGLWEKFVLKFFKKKKISKLFCFTCTISSLSVRKARVTTSLEWTNRSRATTYWPFTPAALVSIHSCDRLPLPNPRASCASRHWALNSTWTMSRLKCVSSQKH